MVTRRLRQRFEAAVLAVVLGGPAGVARVNIWLDRAELAAPRRGAAEASWLRSGWRAAHAVLTL